MPRMIRPLLALLFALMMVIATASAALAFEPPGNSGLTGFDFPAITGAGGNATGPFEVVLIPGLGTGCHPTLPNGGPWNAVDVGPFTGPLEFGDDPIFPDCEDLNP